MHGPALGLPCTGYQAGVLQHLEVLGDGLDAEAVLKGRTPPQLNNLNDYENGVKIVPAFLLNPVSVDRSNYRKVLVESGYYTDDQLR